MPSNPSDPTSPSPIQPGQGDPLSWFQAWLHDAEASEPNDPNAMTLATATPDGRPACRLVLLKSADASGFTFYTNRGSRKGRELLGNPQAALLFHWKSQRRQVRVEGRVQSVPDAQADTYHASRARISRLGAWASDQSRPLPDRATLERRLAEADSRFPGQDVPRPPYWSGFCVVPDYFEFWQDGAHRLHDRTIFERDGDGWRTGKLYP